MARRDLGAPGGNECAASMFAPYLENIKAICDRLNRRARLFLAAACKTAGASAMPIARSKFIQASRLDYNILLAKMFCKTFTAGTKAAYLGLNPERHHEHSPRPRIFCARSCDGHVAGIGAGVRAARCRVWQCGGSLARIHGRSHVSDRFGLYGQMHCRRAAATGPAAKCAGDGSRQGARAIDARFNRESRGGLIFAQQRG
jgi:hypothetical protein